MEGESTTTDLSGTRKRRSRRRGGRNLSGLNMSSIKKAASQPALMTGLQGLAGVLSYTLIPTLFGMNGPLALAAGTASTWLLGAILDWPGMIVSAFVLPGAHIMYSYVQEPVVKPIFGSYIWRLNPGSPIPGTATAPSTDTATEPLSGMGYYPGQMNDAILPGGTTDSAYGKMAGLSEYTDNINPNFAGSIANNRMRLPAVSLNATRGMV